MAETTSHPRSSAFIESIPHPLWTPEQRLHALEQARSAAIPSRLEEDWRKTDPDQFPWPRTEQVEAATSLHETTTHLPAALASPLASAGAESMRQLLTIPGDDYDAKFLYYHKAFCRAPVIIRVPRAWSGETIELQQRSSGPGLSTFTTLVVVERDAEATIVDRWLPASDDAVTVGRTEIMVEAGARLNYVQEDWCGARAALYRRARVQVAQDSAVTWYSFTQGAAWHVARMELMLLGPNSSGRIQGLFAGSGDARADHRTHQYHGAPRCKSDLTFKTLLSGRSHSVYQGLISVPQQSQKTDAYQQCRNLLLEPGTHADAIPKLEIIADDVRCTHGASMGSLNRDQLFYLQSRGLSRGQALRVIATGFAEEVIQKVPVGTVQERWRDAVMASIGEAVRL